MGSVLTTVQIFDDLEVLGADGEPIGGAITPLERSLTGVDRLGGMGLLALTESVAGAHGLPVPLIVLAPAAADLDGDPETLLDAILGADAGLPIDRRQSRVVQGGRGGIADGLRRVRELLETGRWPDCYLLGIDSLVQGSRLRRLMGQDAIVHDGNPDGVVPGEAAVALRLSLRARDGVLATVTGFGEAEEPGDGSDDDAPITGRGLSLSVERALADTRELPARAALAGLVYDRSGPHRRLEELALARVREPLAVITQDATFMPALSAGETGAASGVLALATLAFFIDKQVINGPGVCFFTGDDAWRGAAVVVPGRHRRENPHA